MKKFIIQAWGYIAPGWEGDDGKFSYRRASQLVFIILIFKMVMLGMTQSQYGFYTVLTLCITFLLLAAIISADQIVKALHGLSGLKTLTTVTEEIKELSEDPTKTTTTVAVTEQKSVTHTDAKKEVPEEGG